MTGRWIEKLFRFNNVVEVALFRSTRSGLVVAVADVPGPMVKGVVSFATEARSDDGIPHTLEHLVFMGSHKFAYKGLLDMVANRCLASGTNAWTAQDHTAYTLETCGSTGFLRVLPIYLDHLLDPTLTPDQFHTEVHHVTGEGDNAGVVYSEMQDHESEMESILSRTGKELLYDDPAHPYRVDTGGRLHALRTTCTIDDIRKFHVHHYNPHNMAIVVSGSVNRSDLLNVVERVEDEFLPRAPSTWTRPFQVDVPALDKSVSQRIQFPSDDDTLGAVEMHWTGPVGTNLAEEAALEILFEYMEATAAAPLQKDFVLCEPQLAASATFSINSQTRSIITAHFTGVPVEHLDDVSKRLLDQTISGLLVESAWDMARMKGIIERSVRDETMKMETNAHDELVSHVISHQLFDSADDSLFGHRLLQTTLMENLLGWQADQWVALVKRYFASTPVAVVVGEPSVELPDKLAEEEKHRVEEQRRQLGENGLKECDRRFAEATTANSCNSIPESLLNEIMVKDLEQFRTFGVKAYANAKVNGVTAAFTNSLSTGDEDAATTGVIQQLLDMFPFPCHVHSVSPTKFTTLNLLVDTSVLSSFERAHLPLWEELIFSSGARIDDQDISADDVARQLTKDLVEYSVDTGVHRTAFDRFITLRLNVDTPRIQNLSKWARIFLEGIKFEADRIRSAAQKLIGEAADERRDGNAVAGAAMAAILYKTDSPIRLMNSLVVEPVLQSVLRQLRSDPADVIGRLDGIREKLLRGGLQAHLVLDPHELPNGFVPDPADRWNWAASSLPFVQCLPGEDLGDQPIKGRRVALSVGGSESSFIYVAAQFRCETTDVDKLAATLILAEYSSQSEGPLWTNIRGAGLAYGANVFVRMERQVIMLSLYRCAQPSAAYETATKILLDISRGSICDSNLEAARRSLVYLIMSGQQTVAGAAACSILDIHRQLDPAATRRLCERVWSMKLADVLRLGAPALVDVVENGALVIAAHPGKMKEVKKSFPGVVGLPLNALQFSPSPSDSKSA